MFQSISSWEHWVGRLLMVACCGYPVCLVLVWDWLPQHSISNGPTNHDTLDYPPLPGRIESTKLDTLATWETSGGDQGSNKLLTSVEVTTVGPLRALWLIYGGDDVVGGETAFQSTASQDAPLCLESNIRCLQQLQMFRPYLTRFPLLSDAHTGHGW